MDRGKSRRRTHSHSERRRTLNPRGGFPVVHPELQLPDLQQLDLQHPELHSKYPHAELAQPDRPPSDLHHQNMQHRDLRHNPHQQELHQQELQRQELQRQELQQHELQQQDLQSLNLYSSIESAAPQGEPGVPDGAPMAPLVADTALPPYMTDQSMATNNVTPVIKLEDIETMPRVQYMQSIIRGPDMPSPPSLEQGLDYFKYLTGQIMDSDASQLVKIVDMAPSPAMSLSSPTSPFMSLANLPPQLDNLFGPSNSISMENVMAPSLDLFREAYPDLDPTALELLEYTYKQQSELRSVSPLRCFRSVALMFSFQSRINLYGMLAWTAWHKGNKAIAQEYFDLASVQLDRDPTMSKEELLSALLVLTCAKICSGDSPGWPSYLIWASKTLKRHGGVASFMETETSRWLLLHFAYLDILSVTSTTTPKLLSTKDFEFIFRRPPSSSFSESLCFCCEPVLLMIEQVNELSRSMRSAQATGENLEELYNTAHAIEEQIWALEPSIEKISHLSAAEQRLQVRQFDAFKLVSVLHLYQGALCINASATPIQVLARRLLCAVDDLIDTNVAGMFVFPLFVLGVNSSNGQMRQRLLNHFDRLFSRIHTRSVERVKNLLLKVWELDNSGSRHVDWTQLVDQGFDFRCG